MTAKPAKPALIGIDWGTSSFRAFRMDQSGNILDRISTGDGILAVRQSDFGAVLKGLINPWIKHECPPIIVSGMITSRNGWIETDYVQVPCGARELSNDLRTFQCDDGLLINFVSGVSYEGNNAPDVMRGEETQIIGDILSGTPDKMYLLPGTHSKWVRVQHGKIEQFATYMTGEIFSLLCDHSILGKLMTPGPFDRAGFDQGVSVGLLSEHNLLHSLFFARTLPLLEKLPGEAVADFVSGLLIGTEIQSQMPYLKSKIPLTIIGRSDLADRYEIALEALDINCIRAPEDIAAKGHYSIASSAGLLKPDGNN